MRPWLEPDKPPISSAAAIRTTTTGGRNFKLRHYPGRDAPAYWRFRASTSSPGRAGGSKYSSKCYSVAGQDMLCASTKRSGWRDTRADNGFPTRVLTDAIARVGRGSIDAGLGGGIIKQRVARSGQGRSGGYRMLVAYRAGDCAVFLYAFAKNERENVDPDELLTLREIGATWLSADRRRIAQALAAGILQEVTDDEKEDAP